MTKIQQFSGFLLLSISLAGCDDPAAEPDPATTGPGGKADDTEAAESGFVAYAEAPRWCGEVEGACLRRLGELMPANVDFSSGDARDQGVIASCASHSFIGMLETQLAVERGITVDLSERYQLYANFMEAGNLGDQPDVIRTFPEIVDRFGVMPESSYPYDEVLANAHRFSQDLAQGLEDSESETIDVAVEATDPHSRERFDVLTAPDALGELPAVGGYPVSLPVKAELAEGALVPELEVRAADGSFALVRCFSDEPGEDTFEVTPREFLAACFDHEPSDYFSCGGTGPALVEAEDECTTIEGYVDGWEGTLVERLDTLASVLRSLDQHEAVFVGVSTPLQLENKAASLWHTQTFQGSGHAVTAVGYIGAADLADPAQQGEGLLQTPSMFDAFAQTLEPDYEKRLSEVLATDDAALIAQARTESAFGQRVMSEGGMILFRNSWGSQLGDVEIGVEGFQAMTFTYLLSRLMLVQSRDSLGVAACGELGHGDAFFGDFAEGARDVAWDTVKAEFISNAASSGGDPSALRELIEGCRAME